jgi:hypothetical protein
LASLIAALSLSLNDSPATSAMDERDAIYIRRFLRSIRACLACCLIQYSLLPPSPAIKSTDDDGALRLPWILRLLPLSSSAISTFIRPFLKLEIVQERLGQVANSLPARSHERQSD